MKIGFILKKIAEIFLTLLSAGFLSFCLVYLAPGDAAEKMLRATGYVPAEEVVDALRARLGLDQSFFVQYFSWLRGVCSGDLGTSFSTGKAVTATLFPALKRTLALTWRAFALTVAFSIPLGILCARNHNRWIDRLINTASYILFSVPTFIIGVLFLYLFSARLKWLPAVSNGHSGGLIMPVAVLTLVMTAWMIRQVRTIVLEKKKDDYIIGLRARGISENRIDFVYVLKSSMIPIVTSLGVCFGSMMAGTVLVETIFTWSGLGKIVMNAIDYRDFPVIQGFTVYIALIYCGINLLVDFCCGIADPRTRRSWRSLNGIRTFRVEKGKEEADHEG